jgi:outer membrane protein OmpA-like peptidoglycan-associated protein
MKRWIVKWVFTGVVLGAIMSVSSVFAQDPGDVELGGFGEYMMFDDQRHLEDPVGGGGRLGVFIAPNLSIEGQGSYLPLDRDTGSDRFRVGDGDITLTPFIGRLVYHVPMKKDRTSFLIGAGWIHNKFGSDADIDEDGVNAMLGLSFGGRTVQGRFDFNGNFIPNPIEGLLVDAWDYSATFGISFFLGRGPKDADDDGIADVDDRCPDTPEKTAVDATGCPDSDGDGIFDSTDECPNTAAGTPVDGKGCARDTDADGVADNLDKCAATPKGATVDPTGCPKDSDMDKVFDGLDKCPNTVAGSVVDAAGCPADSDGDKVADGIDKCPNTPAGTPVDATGCPTLFKEGGTTVVLQGVTFTTGKSMLTSESQTMLDTVAATLKANPATKVEVQGHTDSSGSRKTNMRLSQERADAVKNYLVSKGVGADQLVAKGYGPDQPVADNKTAEGRAQNRRVQLVKRNP